jgi:hypothetical protein
MKLNIYNNFKALYYNTLVNFYLYFNTLVPYYDDVILSLSITSFKNIINNNSISLKTINQNRMIKLLYSLNDKDKIILDDDDGFILIDYNNSINDSDIDNTNNNSEHEAEHEAEPKTEPQVESEAEPEAEPQSESESEAEPQAEPEAEPQAEPETEPKTEPEAEPEAETKCYNSLEKKNN